MTKAQADKEVQSDIWVNGYSRNGIEDITGENDFSLEKEEL